jgi:tetratricopeptide (TPR) repeat protein
MSQHDSSEAPPASAAFATETPAVEETLPPPAPETEPEPEPEPEPMTPERVTEWNRYYDVYVAIIALALVFIAAAHRISESRIWVEVKTGQLIAQKGYPIVTDPFTFSAKGQPWVNVAWLFDLANYGVMKVGQLIRSTGGVSALISVNALVLVAAAAILLALRRSGPGLWWFAVCIALALGAMIVPTRGDQERVFILGLGGIAGAPILGPQTWGMLLLAIEIYLLHNLTERRAGEPVRTGRAYALIPLFLLWANVDESFFLGLLLAVGWLLGDCLQPGHKSALRLPQALAILAGCALICLVNPSFYRIYPAVIDSFMSSWKDRGDLLRDDLSFFGSASMEFLRFKHADAKAMVALYPVYYLAIVGVGLFGFFVNRRQFSLGRFLAFVIAAVLWAAYIRLAPIFAVVFAATLALNGQEWYFQRFGTAGRMGRGWTAWSVGGRAVTILLLMVAVAKGVTGYGNAPQEPIFGFTANNDEFPFEAAEFLRYSKIDGNVLNCDTRQGDALIWAAYPERLDYIDQRKHVLPRDIRSELKTVLTALRDSRPEVWRPILDKYNVSVVMLDERLYSRTYDALKASPDWILFHDDGNAQLFGRADAPAGDLASFKANKLDAQRLAFEQNVSTIPFVDRPPTKTTWLDGLIRTRTLVSAQPHVISGFRWLGVRVRENQSQVSTDPANALVAIREARVALKNNPDDPSAFRLLAMAYGLLTAEEISILNQSGVSPPSGYLTFRFRQHATALNFAIMTTPPPTDIDTRRALAEHQYELALLYRQFGYYDLERDALEAARRTGPPNFLREEDEARITNLSTLIDRTEEELQNFTGERQAGPVERAEFLISRNMLERGIREFEEAEAQGVGSARVKARLLDLYCLSGRPDRALEELSNLNQDDPALSTGPGTAAYRHGLMNLLLGNYEPTAKIWWDRALLQLRGAESVQALDSVRAFLQGEPRTATNVILELPGHVQNQSQWEFELGLCSLEAGRPADAITHFNKTIELNPKIAVRPLIAYYLERMGKPLAPPDTADAKPADAKDQQPKQDDKEQAAPPAQEKAAPAKDAESKDSALKSDAARKEPEPPK